MSEQIQLFNSIREKVNTYVHDNLMTIKAMALASGNTEQYERVLGALVAVRFNYDFQLINNIYDVQNLYNYLRIAKAKEETLMDNERSEPTNDAIRFMLDLATEIDIWVADMNLFNGRKWLRSDILRLLVLHSDGVDEEWSCYDENILDVLDKASWNKLLDNNTWLLGAIAIRYLPREVFAIHLLNLNVSLRDKDETYPVN